MNSWVQVLKVRLGSNQAWQRNIHRVINDVDCKFRITVLFKGEFQVRYEAPLKQN